jgi:hypothetical protein
MNSPVRGPTGSRSLPTSSVPRPARGTASGNGYSFSPSMLSIPLKVSNSQLSHFRGAVQFTQLRNRLQSRKLQRNSAQIALKFRLRTILFLIQIKFLVIQTDKAKNLCPIHRQRGEAAAKVGVIILNVVPPSVVASKSF